MSQWVTRYQDDGVQRRVDWWQTHYKNTGFGLAPGACYKTRSPPWRRQTGPGQAAGFRVALRTRKLDFGTPGCVG